MAHLGEQERSLHPSDARSYYQDLSVPFTPVLRGSHNTCPVSHHSRLPRGRIQRSPDELDQVHDLHPGLLSPGLSG